MAHSDDRTSFERSRIGWWLFVALLAAVAAYLAWQFVGLLVLGVFGYYATRPISDRVGEVVGRDWLAAGVTVLLVLVPVIALSLYAGFQLLVALQGFLAGTVDPVALLGRYFDLGDVSLAEGQSVLTALENPRALVSNPRGAALTVLRTGQTVASAAAGTLLLLALSVTLSYFLLKYDDDIADALEQLFGGRDTVAYAYATAVDADLESVFFGNLLFVAVMSVVAGLAYLGTNLLAPAGLGIPMVAVLAALTGAASLIPLVVGKVVYVPVLALLAVQAVRSSGAALAFVGATAVVYFLALDFLPQTFLQPYISGRHLDGIVLVFAYLLGPVLFGWYGFFLLPVVFVAILEALRIVLPELLHGERLTLDASLGGSVGADPQSAGDVPPDQDAENRFGARDSQAQSPAEDDDAGSSGSSPSN
ncbi:AI-2E family transporter [Halosimplex litoreum]|uniref:AI-2E family transporter n=1 Tax=Halosimplex litoreum TaxID=1198301 RepID=A0A7T3G168_9EURY|nr:AI-2E family transporter [Halosimplex litoreum]QPV64474.1 AI-2E family transporter [Halosimplex litoreum]